MIRTKNTQDNCLTLTDANGEPVSVPAKTLLIVSTYHYDLSQEYSRGAPLKDSLHIFLLANYHEVQGVANEPSGYSTVVMAPDSFYACQDNPIPAGGLIMYFDAFLP